MDDIDAAAELSQGERLLLRTVRILALQTGCRSQKCHFELACGCAGNEAYWALGAFVEQLRFNGRRRIAISAPTARTATRDELTILAAFAAAQADDYRGLDVRLAELTAAQPPASLGGAVCIVAQVFALQGLTIPGEIQARAAA